MNFKGKYISITIVNSLAGVAVSSELKVFEVVNIKIAQNEDIRRTR